MAKTGKNKKKCPLCLKYLARLTAAHLMLHGVSREVANHLLRIHKKRRQTKNPNIKLRQCPLPQCKDYPPVSRLGQHFVKFHKIDKDDEIYKKHCRIYTKRELSCPLEKEYSNLAKNWAQKFEAYLKSVPEGKVSDQSAYDRANQVKILLNCLNEEDMKNMSNMKCRQKLCDYFTKRRLQANSVRTYCSNLISFVKYLFWLRQTKMTADDERQLIIEIGKWKHAFGGDIRCEQEKKIRKKVSKEDVRIFRRSSLVQETLKFLRNLNREKPVTDIDHYCLTRNILLLIITLNNANRQGPLYNMTETEFNAAKKKKSKKGRRVPYYVVSVKEHKTKRKYGCAKLVLHESLREMVTKYKDFYRPTVFVTKRERELGMGRPLFVTSQGYRMSSSGINHGFQQVWKKLGLKSDISNSLIRKTVVDDVHRNKRKLMVGVAEHMCHSVKTAEKSYMLEAQAEQSIEASQNIHEIFAENHDQGSDNDNMTEDITPSRPKRKRLTQKKRLISESDPDSSSDSTPEKKSRCKRKRLISESDPDSSSDSSPEKKSRCVSMEVTPSSKKRLISEPDSPDSSPEIKKKRGRRVYNTPERDYVAILFKKAIDKEEAPKLEEIRRKTKSETVKEKLNGKVDPVKLRGCIQNLINRKKK